jgi:hypothetical protein
MFVWHERFAGGLRQAMNSSRRPGCSFALTPLLAKYQTPIATIVSANSSKKALRRAPLWPHPFGFVANLAGFARNSFRDCSELK